MSDKRDMMPPAATRRHPAARLVLFAAAFVFWLALDWPVRANGTVIVGNVVAGLTAAAIVALVMRDLLVYRFARLLDPRRYFWAIVYFGVFALYAVRAGFDVMRRVLHPALPIRPGIVKVQTRLRSDTARTALANSITLMPGTLTLDISDDGTLYVHWINVGSMDEKAARKAIFGPFEWLLGKVLE